MRTLHGLYVSNTSEQTQSSRLTEGCVCLEHVVGDEVLILRISVLARRE
jgi:hypothetical protein